MDDPGDASLRLALASGREEAFAELYDRYGAALYGAAHRILGSAADAEDAVQDLFVALVRARESLAGVGHLRAYLFVSLRRAAFRRLAACRAEAAAREELKGREDRDRPVPVDERAPRLEFALSRLPEEQREVISLKVDGGLTFEEIAETLGISPNTAASRYRYAIEKLSAAITGDVR